MLRQTSSDVESLKQNSNTLDIFLCPITLEIMRDPVIASDGHSYERTAIENWFQQGHQTSPVTNIQLPNNNLIPNHSLRNAIERLHPIPKPQAVQSTSSFQKSAESPSILNQPEKQSNLSLEDKSITPLEKGLLKRKKYTADKLEELLLKRENIQFKINDVEKLKLISENKIKELLANSEEAKLKMEQERENVCSQSPLKEMKERLDSANERLKNLREILLAKNTHIYSNPSYNMLGKEQNELHTQFYNLLHKQLEFSRLLKISGEISTENQKKIENLQDEIKKYNLEIKELNTEKLPFDLRIEFLEHDLEGINIQLKEFQLSRKSIPENKTENLPSSPTLIFSQQSPRHQTTAQTQSTQQLDDNKLGSSKLGLDIN